MNARWLGWRFNLVCAYVLAGPLALGPTAGWAEKTSNPDAAKGVEVGSQLQALIEADWVQQDVIFREPKPLPVAAVPIHPKNPGKVTTAEDAAGGCDGVKTGSYGFHTASREQDAWWQVDLGRVHKLDRVVIYNRCDAGPGRVAKIQILVSSEAKPGPENFKTVYQHEGKPFYGVKTKQPLIVPLGEKDVNARIVRLMVPGKCSFALDEVEVYAADNPKTNIALNKPADQKSVGQYSLPPAMKKAVASSSAPAAAAGPSTPVGAAFPLAHSQKWVLQGRALAERLKGKADPLLLRSGREALEAAAKRLVQLDWDKDVHEPERKEIYLAVRSAVRRIAMANPLLRDIGRLLFVKRHDAGGVIHMCDQFYGCNAKPGGGLFVLEQPFTANPRLVDLLGGSVVEKGRLAGKRLGGGSFLSPDVSFDGQQIAFAYTQAKAYEKYQGKTAYEWGPEISYHLFRCNADGSGLVQLTDGEPDDFDPCWLPNGRLAFISERRGGYLRCGRHCPVYTLFGMAADGSDVVCLSFHETHEWQPSVDNEGKLVYTRWDYVDRDTNIAHHIWTCFPDGRDPRSFHGNYPQLRESRPWMEMDIRAVPGSQKYVATTGAHHGHAFGSLVLINPRVPDDNGMSQLERLTPDVPFPESEGGKGTIMKYMVYGTPWPLSEDDYLCAYDPGAKNHGIYWIDRYGNKELIYRDTAIASMSPMPLAARPCPPILPEGTTQTLAARKPGASQTATMAVMNVYNSDFTWPSDTKITHLRVIQVLPKSTAPPNVPRIGVAQQTNARAVLGTVPVEADGSAHFELPPGKAVYFQALDANGLAVQSMRSATYVHPGERLTCQGCHENKSQPPAHNELPLALRRAPSPIQPDAKGSRPFSYVRLVQPVLDHHCVGCHREKKALDLSGTIEGKLGWSRSYTNLSKYAFYYDVTNGSIKSAEHGGSRTPAGEFGARASKLMKYLGPEHYGVKMLPDDLHRITLWLDCNSEFFGSYENVAAQSRGEVVEPTLE